MKVSRWAEVAAWTLSLALHAALGSYILWSTSTPDLGFEFHLPTEVEFGLSEAVTVSEGPSAPPPEEVAAQPTENGEGEGAGADGGVPDAGPPDAGPLDAGRRRRRRDAGEPLAQADEEGEGLGEEGEGQSDTGTRGVAFLPAGSQIALRLDVRRVRESSLADDVRGILAVLPDWNALLAGSEIDPLEDLDRVLIASPNLQRSRLIVAGRATGGADAIREAAARLAESAGETLEWERRRGVEVAPWHNRDETQRVVAIVGPRHFVICRPEDLRRVLAVARNRAASREAGEHPADALLSMEEGEGLSLEVEGARNFARASSRRRSPLEMVPLRVRLAVSQRPNDHFGAESRWHYEGEEEAEAAAAFWDRMRSEYGRNLIAQILGVGPVLSRARIESEEEHFDGTVEVSAGEMRRILTLGQQAFLDRARARARDRGTPLPGGPGETPGSGTPRPSPPSGSVPPAPSGNAPSGNAPHPAPVEAPSPAPSDPGPEPP